MSPDFDLLADSAFAAIFGAAMADAAEAPPAEPEEPPDGRTATLFVSFMATAPPGPEPASERAVRPHRASARPSLFPSPFDATKVSRHARVSPRSVDYAMSRLPRDAPDRPSHPALVARADFRRDRRGRRAVRGRAEDPVTTSMTISYALPDGTEHASSAPCPVARERAGPSPLEWSGPDAGHTLTIDETSLRALASDPRVAVTFVREGDFPVDRHERAAPTPGPDVVSVVHVELASLILGTSTDAVARFDADANADAAPMPPALAGFRTAVVAVITRVVSATPTSTPPPRPRLRSSPRDSQPRSNPSR